MKAVVMAGGFGTRIQPLTNSLPKPMLPIVNKPMMEHTMLKLRDLGITDFIVLLYFKPDVIKEHFKDGSHLGINITYVLPNDDYGTAGAVKLAQEHIGDENFVIISGDLVTDFDFKTIFDYHAAKKSKLTITLTSVENPLQFGVVIANEEGRIEKFLEKPSWGEVFSDTINTGIYVIEPEILDYIPEGENYDFGKELFPKLMGEDVELMGCSVKGYWRDVGNPESYREVYDDILNDRLDFAFEGIKKEFPDGVLYSAHEYHLDKSVEIIGKVVLGNNINIGQGTKLKNVVIGDHVNIGEYCKIGNSVLWNNVEIGKGTKLDNAVICNGNIIGKNTTAKAGLILAENCELGQLVSVEQDVVIWPDKHIDDAAIVSNNVIWGSKYKNAIFENGSVIGRSNVELSCDMATKLAESFASQLPIGSRVLVSRDDNKSSRMLKRAFLGGLMSSGINVKDIRSVPLAVMRYMLANNPALIAGVHFRHVLHDPTSSEMMFFNGDALRIDSNTAQNVERAFYREKFRRVDYAEIGTITETLNRSEVSTYIKGVEGATDHEMLRSKNFRVVVDLMYGVTSEVFVQIMNDIGIDNILLNAHPDERKYFNVDILEEKSKNDVSAIVKNLGMDLGVLICPNGQTLMLVSDDGQVLKQQDVMLCVLYVLNLEAIEAGEKKRVFLPSWAPDFIFFDNLEIERGKYANFKAEQMRQYDLIATVDGNFAFTDFGLNRDAMFSSLRIMQMLIKHDVRLSEILPKLDSYYYYSTKIPCTHSLKGKMMRKFIEDAKGKESSMIDGIKIWTDKNDWILMIPDQYSDHLNIYVQAKDEVSGKALCENYKTKIASWSRA